MKAKFAVLFIVLMLAACNGQVDVREQAAVGLWIDQPLDNSVLMLGDNIFKVSLSIPNFASTGVDLYLNGSSLPKDILAQHNVSNPDGYDYHAFDFYWEAEVPGTYLLEARAGDAVAYANFIVEGHVEQEPEEPAPEGRVTNTLTSTFTSTLTPTNTATIEPCIFTAAVNLFCRTGPTLNYPEIDTFTPGMTAPVVGQSLDAAVWYVVGPHNGNVCTVPSAERYGSVTGDCSTTARFTPIPPPLPTVTLTSEGPLPVTNTPAPAPVIGCTVRQAGGAIICVAPCPSGASPGVACTMP